MENPVVATVLSDTVPAASADRAVRVEDFTQLCPRAEGDPQRLYGRVTKTLDHYFFTRGLTYLDGQRGALSDIIKEVLDDSRQGVFAVPLVPGGGKSTLLRALLTVFAEVFRGMSDPIAQRLGGYRAIGPLIQGLAAPLHDLSRGCSVEEIIELALVASVPRQTDASRIPDSSTLVE